MAPESLHILKSMNKSEVDKHFFRIPFYYFFLNECYFIDNVTFSYLWASLKYQFSTDIKKTRLKKNNCNL